MRDRAGYFYCPVCGKFLQAGNYGKTESMVENEMEYVSSLISGRLNHAIEICKAAYDEEYENAWREYQIGKQSEELFRERVKNGWNVCFI